MKTSIVALMALIYWAGTMAFKDEGCVTDSECFIQCEKEKGRPCTDEDVFGPVYEDGPCAELPSDHPDYCEQDKENE